MCLPEGLESIKGVQEAHDWFGYWPDFHDAEIVSLHLNREGPSYLAVHTWETTKQVDSQGYYEREKHVVVEFILRDISALSLEGFSGQNVISGLALERTEAGFRLTLAPCYGLSGAVEAHSVSIRHTPGMPTQTTLSS